MPKTTRNFCGRTRREFLWEAGAGFTGVAKPRRDEHGRAALPEHLERREVVHDLTEAEKLCPCCGRPRVEESQDNPEKRARNIKAREASKKANEEAAAFAPGAVQRDRRPG